MCIRDRETHSAESASRTASATDALGRGVWGGRCNGSQCKRAYIPYEYVVELRVPMIHLRTHRAELRLARDHAALHDATVRQQYTRVYM